MLSACSASKHLVPDQDQWAALSQVEVMEVLGKLNSKEMPVGSMRHRINLTSKLDNKSFEQSFVSKGNQFSLSFFAPAYVKILFRIIEGQDRAILVDYSNRLVFELDPSNSISLGEHKLPGIGRAYPEVLEGQISKKSLQDVQETNSLFRKNNNGNLILLEIKQDSYRREYLFEKNTEDAYCLRKVLVESTEDKGSISYIASEHKGSDCVPSRIIIEPEFTSAYLEAILLIKQDTIQETPDPFNVETPIGFREL